MRTLLGAQGIDAAGLHLPNVADIPLQEIVKGSESGGKVQRCVNLVDHIPGDGLILGQTTRGPDAQNIKSEQKKKTWQPREQMSFGGTRVFPLFWRRFWSWCAHPVREQYDFFAGSSI